MRIATYIKHNCVICSKEFKLKKSQHQRSTCGIVCRKIHSKNVNSKIIRKYKHTGENIKCPVCYKVVYRYRSQLDRGYKYCSKKCWYSILPDRLKSDENYMKGILKGLENGSEARKKALSTPEVRAKISKSNKLAFSEGRLKPRYGAENNLWKGGIATLQNSLRATPEYKAWRKAVYGLDNYTCQVCGTNKDLHAHHVLSFSQYPELRLDINNGVTLCRACHSDYHGRYLPDIGKVNRKVVA